jgi:hypothetical protein
MVLDSYYGYPYYADMTNLKHIAATILSQIEAGCDGDSLLAAVTRRDFVSLPESRTRLGGVVFSLKKGGRKILNKFQVELAFDDTYTVSLWSFDFALAEPKARSRPST